MKQQILQTRFLTKSSHRIKLQKIILSQSVLEKLRKHAENEEPNEACAILFGKENRISDMFLTQNVKQSPINFAISNEQLIEGYKRAEDEDLQVVGIFHSHPNSEAFPSKTDKRFMETNPVTWIIYSGVNKEFRAFILDQDIKEMEISED